MAQSVARSPYSPDWTEAVKWACKRGLLQALGAPGLKFSRILEGGPPAGLSSLICKVGVTISAPPSLEGVALPITEPQAALPLVSLSHSPVSLFSQHFVLPGITSLPHPCPRGCCPEWGGGGGSLLVHPGPGLQPELLSLSCRGRMTTAYGGL